jgi:hypothetical protein
MTACGANRGVTKAVPEDLSGNPIEALQRKIDAGKVHLTHDGPRGYLDSLLKTLDIPISSQSLVFSKSSFQRDFISPKTPRALYFNDDVYVGSIPGAPFIEITATVPKLGPVFYTLSQEKGAGPKFNRQTSTCLACHDSSESNNPIPRLLILSVLPDPAGNSIGAASLLTNDQSPFVERFGGWYVTGTSGNQRHLGNVVVRAPESAIEGIKQNMRTYIPHVDLTGGSNLVDLSALIDVKPYPSPHSDIVALMVLAHQTHVHNLMTLATYEVQAAPNDEKVLKEDGELLVRALLFSGAAAFTEPIAGTSTFAKDFSTRGPQDKQGRSLRDLDLNHRLLRYPLSYLIYSKSFDEMPGTVKDYVTRRLHEVLTGQDQTAEFKHLSVEDRQAILEIVRETKPGLLL